jgi:hypothetical protein
MITPFNNYVLKSQGLDFQAFSSAIMAHLIKLKLDAAIRTNRYLIAMPSSNTFTSFNNNVLQFYCVSKSQALDDHGGNLFFSP